MQKLNCNKRTDSFKQFWVHEVLEKQQGLPSQKVCWFGGVNETECCETCSRSCIRWMTTSFKSTKDHLIRLWGKACPLKSTAWSTESLVILNFYGVDSKISSLYAAWNSPVCGNALFWNKFIFLVMQNIREMITQMTNPNIYTVVIGVFSEKKDTDEINTEWCYMS